MNRASDRRGFSLIELLVGITVAAIIAGTAVNAYRQYRHQTQRLDGQLRLLEIAQLQQRYFSEHLSYTTELGSELNLMDADGSIWSKKKIYRITAAACDGDLRLCLRLTATPTAAAAGLQELTLDTFGRRTPAALW